MPRIKAREVIILAEDSMDAFWVLLGAKDAFEGFGSVKEIYLYEEYKKGDLTEYTWIIKGEE